MKKHKIILTIMFLGIVTNAFATKIIVSEDIGFDTINSTTFLETALTTSVADTIVVDNVGMDWYTGPLDVNRDNITIILERGVILRALPGVYGEFDSLLRIRDRSNITIKAYGASIIMNKQEYVNLADSEFRHCVNLESAINIWIEGLTVKDSGGDGFSVSKSFLPSSPQNYCENITLKNCVSNNNYRQGLSLISVKDANILYSEFSDTNGVLPEDGIDIEPFDIDQRIENVLIKGCRILNNNGNAIQVAMEFMDDTSNDISINVEDTYMSSNHDPSNTFAYAELNIDDNGSNGVDGFVNFSNCYIDNSDWTAVYISKTVDSYQANFENCVFKDISNDPIAFNNPIFFEVTDYSNPVSRFGGASFQDCTIIYDEDIPFIDLVENSSTSDGLGDVNGNFYIVNPNSPSFLTGVNPNNVSITFESLSALPTTQVEISASQLNYTEGLDPEFIYSLERTTNTLLPLAVNLNFTGTATYGDDYYRQPSFALFEFGQQETNESIGIINDDIDELEEELQLTLVDNGCYSLLPENEITLLLGESTLSIIENENEITLEFYPNPVKDKVSIITESKNLYLEVFDMFGKKMEQLSLENTNILNMLNYSSGVYILKIGNKSKKNSYRNIKIIKE